MKMFFASSSCCRSTATATATATATVWLIYSFFFSLAVATTAASAAAAAETTTTTTAATDNKNFDHGKALKEWMISSGGYVHPSLDIQRSFGSKDDSPFFAVTVLKDIPKDEVLLKIPQTHLIQPHDEIKRGDRIIGFWKEEGTNHLFSYPATVLDKYAARDEETDEIIPEVFDILYDDGDVHENVLESDMERNLICATVQRLLEEKELGSKSIVAPYINYLLTQPKGQLPPAWSQQGQELLREVLGEPYKNNITPLPPILEVHTEEEFYKDCNMDSTTTNDALNFYHLLNQRGWDEVLIPVFDMMSHGNGRLLNTEHDPVREGTHVMVRASRNIKAGEELYTTYNLCPDCENRYMGYGTPELLRDYGFVESFPQRWFFNYYEENNNNDNNDGPSVGFELDVKIDEATGKPLEPYEYIVTWLEFRPSHRTLIYFRNHLIRLETLIKTILAERPTIENGYTIDDVIPESEWNTIVQYTNALIVALQQALEKSGVKDYLCDGGTINVDNNENNNEEEDGDLFCTLSSTTTATMGGQYDDLTQEDLDPWEDDRPDTCNAGENDENHPYHRNNGEVLQSIKSPYQNIEFYSNTDRNNDTCFMLDQVTQICTSYRPDYHEMCVHNTARYLEGDVKRVLFVGGGDSMLLHNIIQYPTLEKVVGLEIDQFVTRASFFHFGTRPHFDNEKVEWWFGDATKSLLMLPREYFGSFDMVLVDLSETVASLSVTHHMNVMEALSLLLQPKGIMLKNEYNYFPGQKEVFREALHLHWYAVPYVCSQSLVLGSNGLDLMRGKYRKLDVETIYPLLEEPDIHMGYLHDYQKNHTNPQRYCLPGDQMPDGETQEKSPGIMMIIEAEDATADLATDKVKASIEKALEKAGFHIHSSFGPTEVNSQILVTILQEGYVVTRIFPDKKYCAFDVQLWGSFLMHETAKKVLIEAVGSKVSGRSSSSYRIVSGGMFGIETWKDDEKNRGPKIENCDDQVETKDDPDFYEPADVPMVMAAMEDAQIFVHNEKDYMSLVLCGIDVDCEIATTLKKLETISDVIVLRPCEQVGQGVEYMQDALTRMTSCEVETWQALDRAVARTGKGFRSIVLDPSTPEAFAQIVLKIVSSPVNQKRFLAEDMTVVAPMMDLSETWRKMFVDKFRTHIFEIDPTFRGEIYFNSTDGTTFMVVVSSSGDKLFGEKIVQYVDKIEERTKHMGEIRAIRGNTFDNFITQDPIITDQNFTDADFDQESQMENWLSQEPLGLQVLFQFEIDPQIQHKIAKSEFKVGLVNALSTFVSTKVEFKSYPDLGEGLVVAAVWEEGSAMVLFDGRGHVDVSLFMYQEDFVGAWKLEDAFGTAVPGMTRTLRDTFPRGTGRIISFLKDLGGFDKEGKPMRTPKWAPETK